MKETFFAGLGGARWTCTAMGCLNWEPLIMTSPDALAGAFVQSIETKRRSSKCLSRGENWPAALLNLIHGAGVTLVMSNLSWLQTAIGFEVVAVQVALKSPWANTSM